MKTHERTSITMTTTRTNYVSSATGGKKKSTKSSTGNYGKRFVQMKWCQLKLNGEKFGKPFKMPLTVDEHDNYDKYFDKILKDHPRWEPIPENPKVEVDEWLVKHRRTPDNYQEAISLLRL